MITGNNDLNVNNNRLINISVNPNVLNLCELVPEVQVNNVRTEVLDIKDKVREVSMRFLLRGVTGYSKTDSYQSYVN